jgi:nucleoside-diphosphate-sugar epimerase
MSRPVSLVTGACGFMGTHMLEVLHEAGHEVRATDLPDALGEDDRKRGRFPSVARQLGIELVPSDLGQPRTLEPLVKGVDYVFHIAAIFNYTAPWELLYRVNVQGGQALAEAAAAEPRLKRFVLWGAGGVYGLPEPWMLPLREDLAPQPPNNYLRSKWMQEYNLMELGRRGRLRYTIMRPTAVYGPRAVYGGGVLVMSAAQAPVLAAPANFTTRIPFVHVRDVCSAALHLSQSERAVNEIYNLNDDSLMSVIDYMRFMAELGGKPFFKLPPVPLGLIKKAAIPFGELVLRLHRRFGQGPSPIEPDMLAMLGVDFTYSNQKLKDTGYKFIYPDARQGLTDTVRWYKEQGWLKN